MDQSGNVPAFPETYTVPTLEPTREEKIDYLYDMALRVDALISQITPAQIEKVQQLQANPLIRKLFGSF